MWQGSLTPSPSLDTVQLSISLLKSGTQNWTQYSRCAWSVQSREGQSFLSHEWNINLLQDHIGLSIAPCILTLHGAHRCATSPHSVFWKLVFESCPGLDIYSWKCHPYYSHILLAHFLSWFCHLTFFSHPVEVISIISMALCLWLLVDLEPAGTFWLLSVSLRDPEIVKGIFISSYCLETD